MAYRSYKPFVLSFYRFIDTEKKVTYIGCDGEVIHVVVNCVRLDIPVALRITG